MAKLDAIHDWAGKIKKIPSTFFYVMSKGRSEMPQHCILQCSALVGFSAFLVPYPLSLFIPSAPTDTDTDSDSDFPQRLLHASATTAPRLALVSLFCSLSWTNKTDKQTGRTTPQVLALLWMTCGSDTRNLPRQSCSIHTVMRNMPTL